MDLLLEPLGSAFFVRALLAAALVGSVCAVVGTYVVLKGIAFIGAGNISKQYLDNLTTFPDVKVLVIADLFEDAAAARAASASGRRCCPPAGRRPRPRPW